MWQIEEQLGASRQTCLSYLVVMLISHVEVINGFFDWLLTIKREIGLTAQGGSITRELLIGGENHDPSQNMWRCEVFCRFE